MKRIRNNSGRAQPFRVWVYVAIICFVGSWSDFTLNEVTIPLSHSLFIGAFAACGFWLLLLSILGFLGGRHDSWLVTLGGVVLMSFGMHLGEYVYDVLYGVTPGHSLLPSLREAAEMSLTLAIGIVAASISHVVTVRLARRRFAAGHCQKCGYDLTGNTSGKCPECGAAVKGASDAHT